MHEGCLSKYILYVYPSLPIHGAIQGIESETDGSRVGGMCKIVGAAGILTHSLDKDPSGEGFFRGERNP